jgi:hypothetical protein
MRTIKGNVGEQAVTYLYCFLVSERSGTAVDRTYWARQARWARRAHWVRWAHFQMVIMAILVA